MSRKARLYELASAYVEIIARIERTSDRHLLQKLEEERVIHHNRFADALKEAGIPYKDREHVTRIAFRIIREES